MDRDKLIEDCRAGRRHFWVCFDLGNMSYLWWYPTREEARDRYNKHKANPKWADLTPPVKVIAKPKKRVPWWEVKNK